MNKRFQCGKICSKNAYKNLFLDPIVAYHLSKFFTLPFKARCTRRSIEVIHQMLKFLCNVHNNRKWFRFKDFQQSTG